MRQKYMVLTAVGPDRPGIVKEIAETLHTCGCNLEDSRMALLAGKFALVLLLSGSPQDVKRFADACPDLRQALGFELHLTAAEKTAEHPAVAARYNLKISGVDQPGIVHRVTEVLASKRINVVSMDSHVSHAAFTGTPVFSLHAEIVLPEQHLLGQLEQELGQACEPMQLGYALEPTPPREA